MARPSIKALLNMDDPEIKRRARATTGIMKGFYKWNVEPSRPSKSQKQLGYYFSCVVDLFAEFLSEHDVRIWTKEDTHLFLKTKVLGLEPVINPMTGEVVCMKPRHVNDKDTVAFADFVDRARDYLASEYNVQTEDPDPMYWTKSTSVDSKETAKV